MDGVTTTTTAAGWTRTWLCWVISQYCHQSDQKNDCFSLIFSKIPVHIVSCKSRYIGSAVSIHILVTKYRCIAMHRWIVTPLTMNSWKHDDVIKWKHFPHYWPFVWELHRSPVNSLHKGQWRWALMFSLMCGINSWVNNHDAGDLRRHRTHYDVTVMRHSIFCPWGWGMRCLIVSILEKMTMLKRHWTLPVFLSALTQWPVVWRLVSLISIPVEWDHDLLLGGNM